MDLAGRHTSQFSHPALSHTSQLFRLHFYANGFLLRKNLPSFSSGCYVCWCVGLRRLVCCDIWYSRWDGACCLLADPSSPSRRSSIRPEPLEADLSERRSQVVTLSSSSLATAASAGLFHCNAQLLSYRDWQNYTWLISPWSQGPKTSAITRKLEAHQNRCHNTLGVCGISAWMLQTSRLSPYQPNTWHLNWIDYVDGEKLACARLHLCLLLEVRGWIKGSGWRCLEDFVIKAHKTASPPRQQEGVLLI